MIERVRSSAMFGSCVTSVGKAFHCTVGTEFACSVQRLARHASAPFSTAATKAAAAESATAAAPPTAATATVLAVERIGTDVADRRLQRVGLLRSGATLCPAAALPAAAG